MRKVQCDGVEFSPRPCDVRGGDTLLESRGGKAASEHVLAQVLDGIVAISVGDQLASPLTCAAQGGSAFAVRGERGSEAPLELFDVLGVGGAAPVALVDLGHRVAVRRRLELVENPRDESVELVFADLDALGDFFRAQSLGDVAK